ncbi:hypothetical protein CVT25_012736 [Psilocybe cyanescens]|uniref:Probable enoyl-CoA hydratase, mitochondrial n=1 Tax=Psilocybe cyanescens TaxID=93625 RepID=A0A409XSI5_PSICY|nr:hypothetical protein CVT25_012736 [Psilocybe cyanescens]
MSTTASTPVRHRFFVYAPDKTEPGTLERRLSVREKHLVGAKVNHESGLIRIGGMITTPDAITNPDAPKKMVGSTFLFEAESIDQSAIMSKPFFVYVPYCQDEDLLSRRSAVRPAHMEHMARLIDSGILRVGGVLTDPETDGNLSLHALASSMIVLYDSLSEVKKMLESDVYWTSNVPSGQFRLRKAFLSHLLSSARNHHIRSRMAQYLHRSSVNKTLRLCASLSWSPRFLIPQHLHPNSIRLMSSQRSYEYILVSRPEPSVVLVTLNRPKSLNALSSPLFTELNHALGEADKDDSVGAMVLTGSERAFAAGADIKEMKDKQYADVYKNKFLEDWGLINQLRKPLIAAVSGYALGGGCELALMCDIILASPTAKFGQPEINLGVIPGGGGSQRLIHAIGKSRTMELVLTGRTFTAQEASQWGMVSRVVGEGEGEVVKEAVNMAKEIASKGQIAVQAGKEVVNAAYEMTLAEGLRFERRIFHGLFATNDQKEGMAAFAEKRKANFTHS